MWFLLACVWAVALAAATASNNLGILEVDMVFPRNDTYAPTSLLPLVFAIQNPRLAPFLIAELSYTIWDFNNMSEPVMRTRYDMRYRNFSSNGNEPYFLNSGFTKFNTEGNWLLKWSLSWISCTEDSVNSPFPKPMVIHDSVRVIYFTTKNSAQEVDLVATTNNNKSCDEDMGIIIDVTKTLEVPRNVKWDLGKMCAVVASSTPTPDPCRVKINSAAATSISSAVIDWVCKSGGIIPQINCPQDKDSGGIAQRLAVGGVMCLAATLGALGYILV